MTIHVNIGEAKTRLSELVAAAVRGEEVVVAKAGVPQAKLVPIAHVSDAERARLADDRRKAFGMWRHKFGGSIPDLDIRAMKLSDAELDDHYRKKFGDIG